MTDVAPASATPDNPAPARKASWRAHVPGTRQYRLRRLRKAREYMRLVRVQGEWLFETDCWKRIERPMSYHSDRTAISDLWAEAVAGPIRAIIGSFTSIAIVVMPWIVSKGAAVEPWSKPHDAFIRSPPLLPTF